MSRRRRTDGSEEASETEAQASVEEDPKVNLRLTQNAYVGEKLHLKGSVFSFSREEAAKRCKRQKFWEQV